MNIHEKDYKFILEIWEMQTLFDSVLGGKKIGIRNIIVKAETDIEAISYAWKIANESLTSNYFYRIKFKE